MFYKVGKRKDIEKDYLIKIEDYFIINLLFIKFPNSIV